MDAARIKSHFDIGYDLGKSHGALIAYVRCASYLFAVGMSCWMWSKGWMISAIGFPVGTIVGDVGSSLLFRARNKKVNR